MTLVLNVFQNCMILTLLVLKGVYSLDFFILLRKNSRVFILAMMKDAIIQCEISKKLRMYFISIMSSNLMCFLLRVLRKKRMFSDLLKLGTPFDKNLVFLILLY